MISTVWESYTEESQEPVEPKQMLGYNVGVLVCLCYYNRCLRCELCDEQTCIVSQFWRLARLTRWEQDHSLLRWHLASCVLWRGGRLEPHVLEGGRTTRGKGAELALLYWRWCRPLGKSSHAQSPLKGPTSYPVTMASKWQHALGGNKPWNLCSQYMRKDFLEKTHHLSVICLWQCLLKHCFRRAYSLSILPFLYKHQPPRADAVAQ